MPYSLASLNILSVIVGSSLDGRSGPHPRHGTILSTGRRNNNPFEAWKYRALHSPLIAMAVAKQFALDL